MSNEPPDYWKTLLSKSFDEMNWEEARICNSNNTLLWLPVTEIIDGIYRLGLSTNRYWVLEIEECISALATVESMRSLLPLLKKTNGEISKILKDSLDQKELPLDLSNTFPYKELIACAFQSKSEYWTNLALDWIISMDVNDFALELDSLSTAQWLTQGTRQKANKLLKGSLQ